MRILSRLRILTSKRTLALLAALLFVAVIVLAYGQLIMLISDALSSDFTFEQHDGL